MRPEGELYGGLQELIGDDAEEGDDWATVPFMRLQLSYMEVDAVRRFGVADGARAVREAARVAEIDGEAKRLFGLGRIPPDSDPKNVAAAPGSG